VLLTALRESWNLLAPAQRTLPWNKGDLLGYAALALRLLGPERRDELASAICEALVKTEVCTFALPQTLLDLLFPDPPPEGGRCVWELDDVQLTSLRTLLLTQHWRSWMLSGKFLPAGLSGDDYRRAFDTFLEDATGQRSSAGIDLSKAGNVSSWELEQRRG
jgi:hypothetical protein